MGMGRTWVWALAFVGLVGCHHDPTCDDACTHYLSCEGATDAAYQSQCVSVCRQSPGATQDWLNQFVTTDCATAVAMIDGASGGTGGTGGTGGFDPGVDPGAGGGGGCYPDGHACQAGGDCCNGNCIDQSVNDWICY